MTINKLLLRQAAKIEKQNTLAEWAKDFETVEAMLADGISWKTIAVVLSKKYKKDYQVSALVRTYNKQYLKKESSKEPSKNLVPEVPEVPEVQFDEPNFEATDGKQFSEV